MAASIVASAATGDPPPVAGPNPFEQFSRHWEAARRLDAEGKPAEAIAAAERASAIAREAFGPDREEVAILVEWIAERHARRGDFPAARTARNEALAIKTKRFGAAHWEAIDARRALAHVDLLERLTPQQRKQLDEAEQLRRDVAKLYRQGKSPEALPPAERVLAIHRHLLGESHPETAAGFNNLALLHQSMGELARAEPLYEKGLGILKTTLGLQHPETAAGLNNLAMLRELQGDVTRAEPLYQEALEIRRRAFGEEHHATAASLNNLAMLYKATGEYARAEALCRNALAIQQKTLGPEHPDTATSLNNLAMLYESMGDYVRAERFCRNALEIRRKIFGEKHPKTAASLNNLATLHLATGDYTRAKSLYKQAIVICVKTLGEDSPLAVTAMNNLATVCLLTEQLEAAEALLNRVLEIDARRLGKEHPGYAVDLGNLASLHATLGDPARAEPLYREALAIRRNALGPKHPDTATGLHSLAGLYEAAGDYARAEPLYREAFEIRRTVLGPEHLDTAVCLKSLALLYDARGEPGQAEPLLRRSLQIYRKHLDATFSVLSQRRQLALSGLFRGVLDAYLSLGPRAELPDDAAYEHVLAWKGAVFARQREARLALQRADLAPLLAELQSTTTRLATLAFTSPDSSRRDVRARQLEELTRRKEALEGELSGRSEAFRGAREVPNPEGLRRLLPPGVALIDMLEYTHLSPPEHKGPFNHQRRLTAFVVRADRPIARVELGPADAIAGAVDRWRKQFGTGSEGSAAAAELRRRLWQPLGEHLAGATAVLVSPDGAVTRFPLAALPGAKPGSYLIEDLAIGVLPVPRLLADLLAPAAGQADPDKQRAPSLLAVGDVDYDAEAGSVAGSAPSRSPMRKGRALQFRALGNTRGEILAVRDSFELAFEQPVLRMLRRGQATESAIRRQAPRYRFLDLATHGFFATPQVRSILTPSSDSSSRLADGEDPLAAHGVAAFHPGLLSGLALAGANEPPQPEQDDGILTAEEVASLDLSAVELAVLSACETGLGKVAGGEGVLGLQRAFQVAGARSVVASLWKVHDEATRTLMEEFYRNLWEKDLSKLDALREAQLRMLRNRGPRGLMVLEEPESTDAPEPLPPFYWAAFVLSGDWR